MKNYKLIIQYDGTRYSGWQIQGNTSNTIQGKLETLLSIMDEERVEVHGSGRTDAGVHAKGQVANVKLKKATTSEDVLSYCNRYLPGDIAVVYVEEAPERFHARLSAKKKCYRYRIRTSDIPDVFNRNYVYTIKEPLNIEKMQDAAKNLIGEHDFRSFCGLRRFKKSTVRTVYSIDISRHGDEVWIDYVGNGFLNQMVRILTGTIVEVGLGKRTPESLTEIIQECDRSAAGPAMPPQGLCLEYVAY